MMARKLGLVLRVGRAGQGLSKRLRGPSLCCGELTGLPGSAGMGEMHWEPAGINQAGEACGSCIPERVSFSRKWGRAQQPQALGTQPWVPATIPRTCRLPGISRPGPGSSAGGPPGVPAGAAERPERTGEVGREWLQGEPRGPGPCEGPQVVRARLPFPPTLGLQDELRAQTSTLSRQLAEAEAERDSATSRARQLQRAVAASEEGESNPLGPCFALLCP